MEWQCISPEVIVKGFKKCCVDYAVDETYGGVIYIEKTNLMQSSSMFIGNCKIAIANKHTARLHQVGFLYIY